MSITFPSTTGLKFEWQYPDPPEIEYRLLALERYFENTEVLAQTAMRELQEDMELRFQMEVDPNGRPWEPLKQPAKDQVGILRLSEDMYHAAVDDQAWTASPVGVFFDTGELPPYWVYHEQPEGGGNQRIPRRAFIGASDSAQSQIEDMADVWMNIGLAQATRLVASPTTGRALAPMGATTMIGGVARRQVRDPATGRFVSTRPEFYQQ